LKWIQNLINNHPQIINSELGSSSIHWLSPSENDEYAEYRDGAFLDPLGLSQHIPNLNSFWPKSGPQWDALGKSPNKYFLVEAKANIAETQSSCAAQNPTSIAKIVKALGITRTALGVADGKGWLNRYYQYANRLAHLHFLRSVCGVEAELVFVYFCNDKTHIPTSPDEWKKSLVDQKGFMGLSEIEHVKEVFIDCHQLA
jgi:hypothetical protein